MNGLCITDAVKQFGITSKTLRYYERVGLLESKRADNNNYRYYDNAEVERIRQIMVLRKMQISIKDIIRIYENENMSTLVEVFVNRINAINDEINALSELKQLTNEFLQAMLKNGVTKISTLPILYEQMEKQTTNYMELAVLSNKLVKPVEPSILSLPSMRVLSSVRKDGTNDPAGFWRWVQTKGIPQGEPGLHERFEFQTYEGDVFVLRLNESFINDGDYADYVFDGGLFAVSNVYLDEDLNERFRELIKNFDSNKYYQIDYLSDGSLRHPAMLEDLISADDKRELAALLVPIKKRLANPSLFGIPEELTGITIAELDAANPKLWAVNVELDKLTPINNPHYRITDKGEAEYTGWILTRVLNTNVEVKLPFRLDIEFRMGDDGRFGYGAISNSIRFYHGSHGLDHNYPFSVKMDNYAGTQPFEAEIRFHQPVFRDVFNFLKSIKAINNEYHRLTWIIGEKYLSCIINGEVCYCGVNFPYMSLDFNREEARPIIVGSERKIYIRSIRVSQLTATPKSKIKTGELTMITKQSNNIIPVIHRLVTDEYGENYWINGCAKYVMECLGEKDYDYWFFAGLTGDVFTQHYSRTNFAGEAISSYLLEEDPSRFIEDTFIKCGYSATYISSVNILKNTAMYLNTLIAYIDKGIPVITCGNPDGVYVGYEDYGKVLLLITGNNNQPERIPFNKAFEAKPFHGYEYKSGWVFIGEKKENLPLAEIYRKAIKDILPLQSIKTDAYCFGPEAFKAWAKDIDNGKFDRMAAAEFDTWCDYTNYVCVLATNGSCCHEFLKRTRELNPDMVFLEEVSRLYHRLAEMWGGDNNRNDSDNLEALGGGFNVTLEVLKDKEKRGKIVNKLHEFAECIEKIIQVLQNNL